MCNLTYSMSAQQSFMDSEGTKLHSTIDHGLSKHNILADIHLLLLPAYWTLHSFQHTRWLVNFVSVGCIHPHSQEKVLQGTTLLFNAASGTNYILLRLSSLACKSASIPPSAAPALSAWATFPAEAGWATAADGAPTSCKYTQDDYIYSILPLNICPCRLRNISLDQALGNGDTFKVRFSITTLLIFLFSFCL